jgi:hypothetical protein
MSLRAQAGCAALAMNFKLQPACICVSGRPTFITHASTWHRATHNLPVRQWRVSARLSGCAPALLSFELDALPACNCAIVPLCRWQCRGLLLMGERHAANLMACAGVQILRWRRIVARAYRKAAPVTDGRNAHKFNRTRCVRGRDRAPGLWQAAASDRTLLTELARR